MTSDSSNLPTSGWIKARRSGGEGDCVEMRRGGAAVQVRDSKHIDGDILAVPPAQFAAWVGAARRGEFPTAP
jgi:hypothetical protein